MSQKALIALGLSTSHLVEWAPDVWLDPAASNAFSALARRAANAGFSLRIASGFRDYDRQMAIINGKWDGRRPVTDAQGVTLCRSSQSDEDWLHSILRYSALPGTSRHHWGTDLDIWDAAAVDADYTLRLDPGEYSPGGVFSDMTQWLDEQIAAGNAEGFHKPYAADRGGVAPEAWHISFGPGAEGYQSQIAAEHLLALWRGAPDPVGNVHEPLTMLHVVEPRIEALLNQYVGPQ